MSDEQAGAESIDEDVLAVDPVTSDEYVGIGEDRGQEIEAAFPPDHPSGIPFADADVTDESLADRIAQEEPEIEP